MEAEALARRDRTRRKRVPKGTSDYQAAWIPEEEEDAGEEEEDESDDGMGEEVQEEEEEEEEELVDLDDAQTDVFGDGDDSDEEGREADVRAAKAEEARRRRRDEEEDLDFPDEVRAGASGRREGGSVLRCLESCSRAGGHPRGRGGPRPVRQVPWPQVLPLVALGPQGGAAARIRPCLCL